MRELINFLVSKRHWLLFILLEIVSFVMLLKYNTFHQSVFLSSANSISGRIYAVSGEVTSYFDLKSVNKELLTRNGELEMQVIALQSQLREVKADQTEYAEFLVDSVKPAVYDFLSAEVVNNTISRVANFVTLNKGKEDGIAPDMGVVSPQGVVGIVSVVSDHFSVVIPVLNPKLRLSCKVLGSNYFGSLVWDGRSPQIASLEELPRHVEFAKGDTIVTSGFSAVFPEGIPVGVVSDFRKQKNDDFYSLDIKLATDFASLNEVRVIRNFLQSEKEQLEKEAQKNAQ